MTVFVPEQFVHTELLFYKVQGKSGLDKNQVSDRNTRQDNTHRFHTGFNTRHTGFIVLSFVQLVPLHKHYTHACLKEVTTILYKTSIGTKQHLSTSQLFTHATKPWS